MNNFDDINSQGNPGGELSERNDSDSGLFLDLNERDSTGIPSIRQAPTSAISSSSESGKLNAQVLIAGLVLVIGAGAIYGMRYISMQAGLDEEVVSIDYTANANSAEISDRFGKVMHQLDKSSMSIQIADTSSFSESPFSRETADEEVELEPIDPGISEEERMAIIRQRELELAKQRRKDLVIAEAMRMQLQGIIGGSRPAARVSGFPVRVGSELGDFFTVIEITGRSVVIEADGMQFELMIGEETLLISE